LTADILPMGPSAYASAARVVGRGGLIVYPTDTVYGLGCDPLNEGAVRRLFEAKGRTSKPITVLCASEGKAAELVNLSPTALALAREHWPGALTIVAPLRRPVPEKLSQGTSLLGVRVPASDGCLKLISACGGWLAGTSANLSGRPSARTAEEAFKQLGAVVDLVLEGGTLKGKESTVVQVVGSAVTILRTGPVGVGTQ